MAGDAPDVTVILVVGELGTAPKLRSAAILSPEPLAGSEAGVVPDKIQLPVKLVLLPVKFKVLDFETVPVWVPVTVMLPVPLNPPLSVSPCVTAVDPKAMVVSLANTTGAEIMFVTPVEELVIVAFPDETCIVRVPDVPGAIVIALSEVAPVSLIVNDPTVIA